MRRLLDKNYVTHMIGYAGMLHACRYLSMLVQLFDFKISNASFSGKPIDEINKYIKKSGIKYMDVMDPNLYPPVLSQCSDMTSFPKYFE